MRALAALAALAGACLLPAPAADAPVGPVATFAELEAQGARIGEIRIDTRNIFDISRPEENNRFFRLVNRLHVGTRPEDITLSDATLDDLVVPLPPGVLPNFVINDPNNRVAVGPAINPVAPQSWTTPAGTFDTPGRYLVICQFLPHFADAKMYAYVNVH